MYCNKISSYTKQPNKKSYISSLQTPLKKQNFSKKSEICPSAGYSPNIPPPLCGIGVRPRLSFGDNHIIPAYCRISNFTAMTNTLKFLRTFTLDEFKEWKGILQIRIIRNEQTGKYFFGYGDKAGAVTSKYPAEPLDHPVISEVISEESGEQFLLLHNAGDNPQFTTVATL